MKRFQAKTCLPLSCVTREFCLMLHDKEYGGVKMTRCLQACLLFVFCHSVAFCPVIMMLHAVVGR